MIPVIAKLEIEEPRTSDRLFEWVREVYGRFGATEEGRSAFRLREGPYLKEFQEEAWPLASYAKLFHAGRADLLFRPVLGNQSHDALIIRSESHEVLSHVELTTALDGGAGYQERLRTLHLEQHGHAPLTGAQFARDRISGDVPEVDLEMVDHADARDAELDRIRQAVHRKAKKNYPSDTILVVEFRSFHFSEPGDQQILAEFAYSLSHGANTTFREFALVDVPGEIGVRYPDTWLDTLIG